MKTEVSIIILNYNGADRLKNILESVQGLANYRECETIIADNASTDNSREIASRFAKTRFISNTKNIGTPNYNIALKHCNGRYILFVGNDMAFEKDSVIRLSEYLDKNKKAAMACSKLLRMKKPGDKSKAGIDMAGTWLSRSFYGNGFKTEILGNQEQAIPYMGTGMIRRESISKIGGYIFDDDYFFYSEDVDLGLRIRTAGFQTDYVPDSIMYHEGSTTSNKGNRAKFTYLMERNSIITAFKMCSLKSLITILPYFFLMRLAAILKDILTLRIKTAAYRIFALAYPFIHLIKILRKRKETQQIRKAYDNYVFSECREKYLFKSFIKRV